MIKASSFNRLLDGRKVGLYTLRGKNSMQLQLTNYGAKIVSWLVPDKEGRMADVVLGFPTLDEWLSQEPYFNGINGRCTGRIKNGRFTLDGKTYQLVQNSGENALHGGLHGFNEKVWDVIHQTPYCITLHYYADDGEEGYPGNLSVTVTYTLTRTNALNIRYQARTDAPTIVNLTNHAYFNLKGEGQGSIHDHSLQVLADEYIPYDETTSPTGEVLKVTDTPMDFRQPVLLKERINDPFFAPGKGIDNGWALPGWKESGAKVKTPRKVAVLQGGGRSMEVWTNFPCLQVYSGNYLEGYQGKSRNAYSAQTAICLEAQGFPDAINHPSFPSPVLRPGETYEGETLYRFA